MKQDKKSAAVLVAQLNLLGASASWPGNTGQCVVDPQPGYNLTVRIKSPGAAHPGINSLISGLV